MNLKEIVYSYGLVKVERKNLIDQGGRSQSVAEHVCTMILLGNYLYSLKRTELNYEKLIKSILYHDIAEIEMDDTFVFDQDNSEESKNFEKNVNNKISMLIPKEIKDEYLNVTKDFIDLSSIEARYASGIDALDPMLISINIKDNWIGFTEEKIRKYKQHRVKDFPEQLELFEKIIEEIKIKKYIE